MQRNRRHGALAHPHYLGCALIWTNYINRPLPFGGNGLGAVPKGSEGNQGALNLGETVAVSSSCPYR